MSLSRCRRMKLLPPLLVMFVVTSLLLFFYSDTPYPQPRRTKRSFRKANRQVFSQFSSEGPPLTPPSDVTSTSSVTSKRQHVILLSLARSGSSFVADVISHAPGIYYVFEPLKKVDDVFWRQYSESRSPAEAGSAMFANKWRQKEQQRLVHSFLSCDFNDLDLSLLDDNFLHRSTSTWSLQRCMQNPNKPVNVSEDCVPMAQQACRDSHTTLLKVIRLQLRDLVPFVTRDPDLKVILLVRDPRASLWSQVTVFNKTQPEVYGHRFEHACHQRLDEDLNTILQLPSTLRSKIRILRYEKIAEDPIRTSKILYRFLGLEWRDYMKNRIRAQTHAEEMKSSTPPPGKQNRNDRVKHSFRAQALAERARKNITRSERLLKRRLKSPFSVFREDSVKASQAWRTSAPWSFVHHVQRKCFGVLRRLGYSLFRSEDQLRQVAVTSAYQQKEAALEDGMWLL
ncbi:hypothetical protein ACOMHN_009411 [Nucella lapillus]